MLESIWRYLNPRWRRYGGEQMKTPRWSAIFYAWAQAVTQYIFCAIERYHFDLDHPERWQKG
jgi:hypothetical protein